MAGPRKEEDRYTPEQEWDKDTGMVTLDNDELRKEVAVALSKIPMSIADCVLDEVRFIMPMSNYEHGFICPKGMLNDKALIGFPEKLLEQESTARLHIVLHEVAHFYLNHKSPLIEDLSYEETDKQEKEADKFAEDWLKSGTMQKI